MLEKETNCFKCNNTTNEEKEQIHFNQYALCFGCCNVCIACRKRKGLEVTIYKKLEEQ